MDPQVAPPARTDFVPKFLGLAVGLAIFIPLDAGVLALQDFSGSMRDGLVFAAGTLALALVMYRYGWRWQAAGLIVGFALMTMVTSGQCTLFPSSQEYGMVGGILYAAVAVLALLIAGIAHAVTRRRKSP